MRGMERGRKRETGKEARWGFWEKRNTQKVIRKRTFFVGIEGETKTGRGGRGGPKKLRAL